MILVHSYGKVASTSLTAMLTDSFSEVFYSHGIQAATIRMLERHFESAPREGDMWSVMSQIPTIRQRLEQASSAGEEVTIFTGVRDPITRSLSATMQMLPMVFTNLVTTDPEKTAVRLADYVAEIWDTSHQTADPAQGLAGWALRAPLFWLMNEIEEPFDFKLDSVPFRRSQGYCILKRKNVRLAIYRQEDAEVAVPALLCNLYNNRFLRISRQNAAVDKGAFYSKVYTELKKRFRLPRSTLNSIYNNKYVLHYYGEKHAERSVSQWSITT